MADNKKRYYWLKLKEDFFDDDAIEWLEEQPNGKQYSLFYLKLCLKSLRENLFLDKNIGNILMPYDFSKLSAITRTDIDTVTVAMKLLGEIGLVEICESGEIAVNGLDILTGSNDV